MKRTAFVLLGLLVAGVALAQVVGPRTRGGSGSQSTAFSAFSMASTDESGTPGDATINKISGRVTIPDGDNSITVTNSTVSNASKVFCTMRNSMAAVPILCFPLPGGFQVSTIDSSNVTGGDQIIDFIVVNPF